MHLNPPTIPSDEDKTSTATYTVAAALAAIRARNDLPDDQRRKMINALKKLCQATGMPAEALVLTPGVLRDHPLAQAAAVHYVSARSMRGIRSGLRDVLRRLGIIDQPYPPANPAWRALLDKLDPKPRGGLTQFARYSSMTGITPEKVSGDTLTAFRTYLKTSTAYTKPGKLAATIRLVWNRAVDAVDGWPANRLPRQQDTNQYTLPLPAFPEPFQLDHVAFGARLAGTDLTGDPFADDLEGQPADDEDYATDAEETAPLNRRPLRPSTVALRQDHSRWAASALVACGVPISAINSFSVLVSGQHPNRILRYLYERGGNKPNAALTHVGEVLRIIAKYYVKLPKREVSRISALAKRYPLKYDRMTLKNERTVREVMQPETEEALLMLPEVLMKAAHKQLKSCPTRATSLALRAVLIEFFLNLPFRLSNVQNLRLDQHLHRADPKRGLITGVLIPEDETKTDDKIVASVVPELGSMMETWITWFRTTIAAPECPYLFPGDGTGHKPMTAQALRDAVRSTTLRYIGVAITPHQFRHLAAKRYLKAYLGQYEAVRQMLGHKSVETTRRSYAGTDFDATMERLDALLTDRRLDVRRRSAERGKKARPTKRRRGRIA